MIGDTCSQEQRSTYKPQCDNADDVHEDVTTLTEYDRVQLNKRLGCGRVIIEKRIRTRLLCILDVFFHRGQAGIGLPRKTGKV
jgi:hypothetical protein